MPLSRINSASIANNAVAAADIADGTITAAKIVSIANTQITGTLSVANTSITGNIISSQITSVANTQITGNIISSQITSNPTLYGNVSVTGVIAVGGATTSTSGSGISFPSSQSASSDANTLDDYEEGSFTPTAIGQASAGTTTYGSQIGDYVKIGRQVTARVNLGISAVTGTGELVISLPFVASSEYIGSVMTNNLNWIGGTSVVAYTNPTTATCRLFFSQDDAIWQVQQCTNEAFNIMLTVTYFI